MILVPLIILMVVSPFVGLILLKRERASRAEIHTNFKTHISKYPADERLEAAKAIYQNSGFVIKEADGKLLVSRKEFSFAKLFFGYFFLGVGAVFYIFWFLLFERARFEEVLSTQKPS